MIAIASAAPVAVPDLKTAASTPVVTTSASLPQLANTLATPTVKPALLSVIATNVPTATIGVAATPTRTPNLTATATPAVSSVTLRRGSTFEPSPGWWICTGDLSVGYKDSNPTVLYDKSRDTDLVVVLESGGKPTLSAATQGNCSSASSSKEQRGVQVSATVSEILARGCENREEECKAVKLVELNQEGKIVKTQFVRQ